MRKYLVILIALVAVASVALAGRLFLFSPEPVRPEIGGPFTLTGADGKPVSDAAFRGKLMLVFFGYTFCPDVCPTGLSQIAQAMDLLGKDSEQVVPVLISIDPERDGPAQIGAYVANFHPRLIGLTGTPEQIAAVAKSYRAYYAKAPGGTPEEYSVDHSSFTYLMARDGTFRAVFSHGSTPEAIAKGVREHL
ncbi:MAG: SCO family protein [Alphaproteobacteria bacterium]|nr:SCO family protein [Alphaproteobacteria bacterium]